MPSLPFYPGEAGFFYFLPKELMMIKRVAFCLAMMAAGTILGQTPQQAQQALDDANLDNATAYMTCDNASMAVEFCTELKLATWFTFNDGAAQDGSGVWPNGDAILNGVGAPALGLNTADPWYLAITEPIDFETAMWEQLELSDDLLLEAQAAFDANDFQTCVAKCTSATAKAALAENVESSLMGRVNAANAGYFAAAIEMLIQSQEQP